MASSGKTAKSPTAAKASRPVTLKYLAAVLAEEHQLTKRACEAVLGDLVGTITKHLKKGERIRIAGLGIQRHRSCAALHRALRRPVASGEQCDQALGVRATSDAMKAQASIPTRHGGSFWKKANT